MRFVLLVLIIGLPWQELTAQNPPAAQDAQAQRVMITPDKSTRMTVSVTVDGKGPYPFVIDTGSERTVVSRELASHLALPSAGSGRLHSISQSTPVDLVHLESLKMANYRSADLRAPIVEGANLGAAGLIGIDSLQRRRVIIDFRRGEMTIQPPAPAYARLSENDIVVKARKRDGRLVIVDASVDGERVVVILDTGSQVSLGNAALKRKLFEREGNRPAELLQIQDVTGNNITATYTTTSVVRIGDVKFGHLPIALADAPVFRELGYDDKPALLLGMDALKLFDKVSIDFQRRTARFVLPETGKRMEAIRMASLN